MTRVTYTNVGDTYESMSAQRGLQEPVVDGPGGAQYDDPGPPRTGGQLGPGGEGGQGVGGAHVWTVQGTVGLESVQRVHGGAQGDGTHHRGKENHGDRA